MTLSQKVVRIIFQGGILKSNERTWKEAFLYFVPFLILFSLFSLSPLNLNQSILPDGDGHFYQSVNMSYVKTFCKEGLKLNQSINQQVPVDVPFQKLFWSHEGEKEKFCAQATRSIVNERSLYLVYQAIFGWVPNATFKEVYVIFTFLKLSLILMFSLLLFRIGISPFFVYLSSVVALMCLYQGNITHGLSIYTLFTPFFLFYVFLCAVIIDCYEKKQFLTFPLIFVLGFFAAFYSNWRTSHAPMILFIFFTLIVSMMISEKKWIKKIISTLLAVSFFAAGWVSFGNCFLKEEDKMVASLRDTYNYTFHSVAHPLVLALGIDKSDLALQEGIAWDDRLGEALAKKIDPDAVYLGETYEKALLRYYFDLWENNPLDVLEIYIKKIYKNGSFYPKFFKKFSFKDVGVANVLFSYIIWFFFLMGALFIMPFLAVCGGIYLTYRYHKNMSAQGVFLSLAVLGSFSLFYAESVIIMHHFTLNYHSVLVLLYFLMISVYLQLGVSKILAYAKVKKPLSSVTLQPKTI